MRRGVPTNTTQGWRRSSSLIGRRSRQRPGAPRRRRSWQLLLLVARAFALAGTDYLDVRRAPKSEAAEVSRWALDAAVALLGGETLYFGRASAAGGPGH